MKLSVAASCLLSTSTLPTAIGASTKATKAKASPHKIVNSEYVLGLASCPKHCVSGANFGGVLAADNVQQCNPDDKNQRWITHQVHDGGGEIKLESPVIAGRCLGVAAHGGDDMLGAGVGGNFGLSVLQSEQNLEKGQLLSLSEQQLVDEPSQTNSGEGDFLKSGTGTASDVGTKIQSNYWIVRNSWGASSGDEGSVVEAQLSSCPQIEGFFGPRVPVDNLDGGIVGIDHFGGFDLQNPVILSPNADGLYRANQFKEGLAYKYGWEDIRIATIFKQQASAGAISVDQMDLVGDVKDCDCIIVDDKIDISTAGALCKAADVLVEQGARRVFAFASHGLLSGPGIANSNVDGTLLLGSAPSANEDTCNGQLALVDCQDPSANWLFSGAQLFSAKCWINGHSAAMTVNEDCTSLELSLAENGVASPITRAQSIMFFGPVPVQPDEDGASGPAWSWRDFWNLVGAVSDIRLKHNIHLIGESSTGIPIYSFQYRDGIKLADNKPLDIKSTFVGVMAQDLLELAPHAVTKNEVDGYYRVDYSKIDVDFGKL